MKDRFRQFGVTEERYEGQHGGSFEKQHQPSVLIADIDNVVWEKAHLALYCSVYPDTDKWGRLMRIANNLYQQGEHQLCLDHLRKMVEYLGEGNTGSQEAR